ncbi:hypothetical protein [Kribbella ginsengisoli]|uniref:ATP-binding protein n=1 Tax=Kribbella ginsengisoli TaxID=363865 RepID=A0ABP6YZE2_9ACTN
MAQTFPPDGASAAEGIRNQLGRPELDLLTILVREAAQNSWDARVRGLGTPVEFQMEFGSVSAAHLSTWRELLLQNAPLDHQLPLRGALRPSDIRILSVSDRGTTGLGGPTRADVAQGENHDFVSFVRNIGEPRDTELGGGTYGFGKGIFYLVSKPGTVLLHTRCATEDGLQTRLIGCALWKSYVGQEDAEEKRYTGRHWWGDPSSGIVEPLIGEAADQAARRLGLRPFEGEETGTTVVIIDPVLDGLEPAQAAEYVADTIAWQLWPKMLMTGAHRPSMRFSVRCDGNEVSIPDPEHTRPLDLFVAAYRELTAGEARTLECRSPKKVLGRLGLAKRVGLPVEASVASLTAGVEDIVHHVCLMRPAELVVTYHKGPRPPSELLSYAGVFRADAGMDDVYARAEPPTHDSWNPHSLQLPESTFVRTTFRRIGEALEGLLELGGSVRGGSSAISLGAASGRFASLVTGAEGLGGATDYRSHSGAARRGQTAGGQGSDGAGGSGSGGGSTARRSRIEYDGDPYLDHRGGRVVVIQDFRLPDEGEYHIHVDTAVLAGPGTRETEPPLGADVPEFVGWERPDGPIVSDRVLRTVGGDGSTWRVMVSPASDTVTEIDLRVESLSGSR